MTDPEINLAIAELCGLSHPFGFAKLREALHIYKNRDDHGMCLLTLAKIPNYSQDLNAMHEAWNTLDRQQRITFSRNLREVILIAGGHEASYDSDIAACVENATPRHRAEAFIAAFTK